MMGLPLGFAQPLVLLGLLSIPVLWWLLRLIPPQPRRIDFPPTRLLFQIKPKEETPQKTPWWLTLLRLTLATQDYKGRMLRDGLWAAGALTIGLGVLPVVAGLAVLWRAPGEPMSYALRVFRSVLLAAIICFGVYTAVKATYVSISFGTYTYERNLIYLAPLLFTGTALWLERRRLHPIALAASSAPRSSRSPARFGR